MVTGDRIMKTVIDLLIFGELHIHMKPSHMPSPQPQPPPTLHHPVSILIIMLANTLLKT